MNQMNKNCFLKICQFYFEIPSNFDIVIKTLYLFLLSD